jgi:hypothetical protein
MNPPLFWFESLMLKEYSNLVPNFINAAESNHKCCNQEDLQQIHSHAEGIVCADLSALAEMLANLSSALDSTLFSVAGTG